MEALLEKMALQRSKLVIFICLLFTVLAAIGVKNLYFRGDYKVFFADDNQQRVEFEAMQSKFNKSDNVGILIAPQQGSVFNLRLIEMMWNLTEDAWLIPYSTRVDSITNYQHTIADQNDLLVDPLLYDPEELDQAKVDQIEAVTLSEPTLVNKLISTNGHASMINITVQLPDKLDTTTEAREIAQAVSELVNRYQADYPDVDFHLVGILMMNNAFFTEAESDATTLLPGMFVAIILMLVLLLRSLTATMGTLVVIITSVAATLGITGWAGLYLSSATVNVPIIVMTLAVADCVHMAAGMLHEMRQGKSKRDALAHSLKLNFQPIFITSATTAIGFLTFNFSDVPPLRDLGNMVAVGVLLAWIFSVTLFPAWLWLLPVKVAKTQHAQTGLMERFADMVVRRRHILLIATSVVIVGMTALAPRNTINDVAIEYFEPSLPVRQDAEFMLNNLAGYVTLDISLETGKTSGVNDPEFLQSMERFANWLRSQPEVDHVFSLTDTFKRLNMNMNGDDEAFYRLPEVRNLAAQYLLSYEMSLPFGLDLNNQLNISKSAVRMTVTQKSMGSREQVAFEQRVRDWLAQNEPELNASLAGIGLMFAHIGEANMSSMLVGTGLAVVLISALLIVALRSWKLGLISLVPNIIPAGIGFGFWALYNGNINLALSVVTSMCLGIVVDDTVHFLSKYQYARKLGKDAEQAVRYAFSSVGRALWITTLVLFTGFMVLSLSDFTLNGHLGLLTAAIIAIALAVDFLFLPVFLMLLDKGHYKSEDSHVA